MDDQGNYHECDACDYEAGMHACDCGCGVMHRPPTEAERAAHLAAQDKTPPPLTMQLRQSGYVSFADAIIAARSAHNAG